MQTNTTHPDTKTYRGFETSENHDKDQKSRVAIQQTLAMFVA